MSKNQFDFHSDSVAPVCLNFPTNKFDINNGTPVGETGSVSSFIELPVIHEIKQFDYQILANLVNKSNTANITAEVNRGKMCDQRPECAGGDKCAMVQGATFPISREENCENVY